MDRDEPPADAFVVEREPHLGDCDRMGALRLDAVAGFLQDAAGDDARRRAASASPVAWLVRRMDLEVRSRPRAHVPLRITTWPRGVGPAWVERRIADASGAVVVEASTVWAAVDPESRAPVRIEPARVGLPPEAPRVPARLRIPAPPEGAARPWPPRTTDFDAFGHVNNAVYWSPVEACLEEWAGPGALGTAVMEFRDGIAWGEAADLLVVADDALTVWFTVRGAVRAAARFTPGV
jgi:acyl-ACP thioesterase